MKLDPNTVCPLSPALVLLLQACIDARCIRNQTLADHLCQSPDTVHTNFRRIADALGTHDRFEAICMAHENGWIRFAPPPPLKYSLRIFHEQICQNCPQLGAVFSVRRLLYSLYLEQQVIAWMFPSLKATRLRVRSLLRREKVDWRTFSIARSYSQCCFWRLLALRSSGTQYRSHQMRPYYRVGVGLATLILFSSTIRTQIVDVGLD